MRAYLDNNIVSSIVKDDNPSQSAALTRLVEAYDQKKIELVTSQLTLDEIKQTPEAHRPRLERTFYLLAKVPVVQWETLVAMSNFVSTGSRIVSPIFQDDPLYKALQALGVEVMDARHLFVAAKQRCDAFITCDGGVLSQANQIQKLCNLIVQRPSEFVASQGL
jgi:predicted nucleic acid-binding protein